MDISGYHASYVILAVNIPETHRTGGWVGPIVGPDDLEKRKIYYI
jgi:hypothetical protein